VLIIRGLFANDIWGGGEGIIFESGNLRYKMAASKERLEVSRPVGSFCFTKQTFFKNNSAITEF